MPQAQFAILLLTVIPPLGLADYHPTDCESVSKAENRNHVNPAPFVLSLLSGQVIAEGGNPGKSLGAIPKACIGLFSEDDRGFIDSRVADDDGTFSFKGVPPGDYRLLVIDPHKVFCMANISIRIQWGNKARGKRIVVHLKPTGIDTCSYADYK